MDVTLRGPGRWRRLPSAVVSPLVMVLAVFLLAGCSQLAGALSDAIPTAGAATSSPGVSAGPPSAGPLTPSALVTPHAAGPSAGATVGGHVGSHAIVCLDPVTPSGGGGPPCVPVADALLVGTAEAALSPGERAAVATSGVGTGAAACVARPQPTGCTDPDSPLGVVTFQLRDGMAPVVVLVFRRVDGSLGATRLA